MDKAIKISDYDYSLPEERIAKFPLPYREQSRLAVFKDGEVGQGVFSDICDLLPEESLVVFNNTRVVRARIIMNKQSGARIEIFCLEPLIPADYERAFAVNGECSWYCMAGNLKKWKEPVYIEFDLDGSVHRLTAARGEASADGVGLKVHFSWDADLNFGQLLELLGRTPIPPYLGRDSQPIDESRYQTVYARFEGSVAAPTAGLHFTSKLLEGLTAKGIRTQEITLHVGAGTFLPVKSEFAADHTMHTEHFSVDLSMLKTLRQNLSSVVAVGTTTVRTLESLVALGYRILVSGLPDADKTVGQWEIYGIPADFDAAAALDLLIGYLEGNAMNSLQASTRIMIMPGFVFRIVNILITNFHQPQSTLLLLVSAFTGERWKIIYDYALANDFRFLSYGDSSLLWRS